MELQKQTFKFNINDKKSLYNRHQSFNTAYYTKHSKALILSEFIEIKEGFFNKCFYGSLILIRYIYKKLTK